MKMQWKKQLRFFLNVGSEIGRTTDPVRMYMREMGTVDLLSIEDEISIAKRIAEGIDEVQTSIAAYPEALNGLLKTMMM